MHGEVFARHSERDARRDSIQGEMVLGALNAVHGAALEVQEQVSKMFSPTVVVDEMSLLFGSEHSLAAFVRHAVRNSDYELFNTAQDVITTTPIRRQYQALYWFLATPYAYRLELMVAGSGSPVHDERVYALAQNENASDIIACISMHASFKCTDEADYADAVRVLRAHDYELVQGCTSAYGRFSYWQGINGSPDAPAPLWYLKPRVNLRDVEHMPFTRADEAAVARETGRG